MGSGWWTSRAEATSRKANIEDRCAKISGDRCAKKGAGLVLCIVCASAFPGGGHRGPFPVQAVCTQLQRGPPLCCRRPGEVFLVGLSLLVKVHLRRRSRQGRRQ